MLPHPVVGFHTNTTTDAVFTLGCAVAVAGLLAWALLLRPREGSWTPLLFVLGGAAGALAEPIACTNGFVQYPPRSQQWVALEAYGHPVPLLVVLSYSVELGTAALGLHRLLARGGGGRAVLQAWAVVMVVDTVLEIVGINLDVFRYYGHQPFQLFGFPFWWAPLDAAIGLLPALVVHALDGQRRHHAWQAVALVLLFPTSQAIVYFGTGWPTFVLLNTALPAAVVWAGGTLTVGLCISYVRGLAVIADRMPEVRVALQLPSVGRRPAAAPEERGTSHPSGGALAHR